MFRPMGNLWPITVTNTVFLKQQEKTVYGKYEDTQCSEFCTVFTLS